MFIQPFKNVLLIAFLLAHIAGLAQNKSDTIHWRPDYKLKWEDFQGEPDDSIDAARCATSLVYKYIKINNSHKFNVNACFYKKISWGRKNIVDQHCLIHEQGHFDICEIFARQTETVLNDLPPRNESVNEMAKKVCDSMFSFKIQMDDEYDSQTLNGGDHFKQREWNQKIQQMLIENKK